MAAASADAAALEERDDRGDAAEAEAAEAEEEAKGEAALKLAVPRASMASCAAERGRAAGDCSACSRAGVVAEDEDEAVEERTGVGRREYDDIFQMNLRVDWTYPSACSPKCSALKSLVFGCGAEVNRSQVLRATQVEGGVQMSESLNDN